MKIFLFARSWIMAIIICTGIIAVSNASEANKKFTQEEIVQDVIKYVDIVFGEKIPTLEDYYNYDGVNSELEIIFENEECVNRGLAPPYDSSSCNEFRRKREEDPSKYPSYYYLFLRELLNENERGLIINDINSISREGEVSVVVIKAVIGSTPVEFTHAGDLDAIPLGLIGISKVGHTSITDIFNEKVREQYNQPELNNKTNINLNKPGWLNKAGQANSGRVSS